MQLVSGHFFCQIGVAVGIADETFKYTYNTFPVVMSFHVGIRDDVFICKAGFCLIDDRTGTFVKNTFVFYTF